MLQPYLLQQAAKLACSAADIFAELNLPATTEQPRLANVLPDSVRHRPPYPGDSY